VIRFWTSGVVISRFCSRYNCASLCVCKFVLDALRFVLVNFRLGFWVRFYWNLGFLFKYSLVLCEFMFFIEKLCAWCGVHGVGF